MEQQSKQIIVLGAGTAGTSVANQLSKRMPDGWELTVVDPQPDHLYQPDLIFIPFGMNNEKKLQRPRERTLRKGISWIRDGVTAIDRDRREVMLDSGALLSYDFLVVASGSEISPEDTPGLLGEEWRRSIHEFYTLEGARALRPALEEFSGGRLVVNVVEMPIKCPVAPLEFLFLADQYFTEREIRDQVELVYVTPLDAAFTRPLAASKLSSLLEQKGIKVVTEFNTGEVDAEQRLLRSYDEREVPYDLLVSVPIHRGAKFVANSGMGDELDFIPTDRHTLQMKGDHRIFVLGDATDLPTSKAGSVAHFQSEVVVENILRAIDGESLLADFDGHATCFIESGYSRALLIDFNYEVEPLPGHYPIPGLGPFSLLKETRRNHLGKRAFNWLYWKRLLPGKSLFVPNNLSMKGKHRPRALLPAHQSGDGHVST